MKRPPPSRNTPFWTRRFQRTLLAPFLLAPCLALGIELIREPKLEPEPGSPLRTRALGPFFSGILAMPGASEFECTLEELNAHLAQAVASSLKPSSSQGILALKVKLDPDSCHLLTQRLWRGHIFHVRTSYRFSLKEARLVWEPLSAQCGRIALGKRWVAKFEPALLKLAPHLKKERVLLGRIAHLDVRTSVIRFRTRPSIASPQGGQAL